MLQLLFFKLFTLQIPEGSGQAVRFVKRGEGKRYLSIRQEK